MRKTAELAYTVQIRIEDTRIIFPTTPYLSKSELCSESYSCLMKRGAVSQNQRTAATSRMNSIREMTELICSVQMGVEGLREIFPTASHSSNLDW